MRLAWPVATTSTTGPNGGIHRLEEGIPWDADDPLVKHRPHLFTDEPTRVMTSVRGMAVVEQATAAPGEKRRRK